MVELLTGNKIDRVAGPAIRMAQIEHVLSHDVYYEAANLRFATELTVAAMHSFSGKNKVFIYHFDAKYNNKNLVYSIAGRNRVKEELSSDVQANTIKKEVDLFLTFRGSTTGRDWYQNFKTPMVNIALRKDVDKEGKVVACHMIEPLTNESIEITEGLYEEFKKIVDDTGEDIRIHSGFLGYLFADRGEDGLSSKTNSEDDKKDQNLDNLDDSMFYNMRKSLLALMDDTSTVNRNLYVTGHSLGGALAHTAAFFLASDKQLNSKKKFEGVKCITFAAPMSGNISFQRAFEVLARKEHYQTTKDKGAKSMLTNVRITNSRDPVPTVVPFSDFRHTPGITAHLGRPFWLLRLLRLMYLGFISDWIQSPTIRYYKAHSGWGTLNWRYPWMILSPTSFLCGFFASWGRFLCMMLTTVPVVFIIIHLLVRQVYILVPKLLAALLPNNDKFNAVFQLEMWNKWYLSWFMLIGSGLGKAFEFIGGIVSTTWFPFVAMSLFMFAPGRLLNSIPSWRLGLVVGGIPAFISFLVKMMNKNVWDFWNVNGAAAFIISMLVMQLLCFLGRAPWDILGLGIASPFKVHLLTSYYDHLRPFHKQLSSSEVLAKNA